MSEENKNLGDQNMCQDIENEDEILQLICKIKENYKDNFEAQAELFKSFFGAVIKKNAEVSKVDIKDFISKQTPDTRFEVIRGVLNKVTRNENVLYLGIPGSLGRSYSKVEKQVEALLAILKDDKNDFLTEIVNHNEQIKVNATTTSIMYLFFPEKFIPIAGPIIPLLKKLNVLQDDKVDTWEKYENILNSLKGKFKPNNSDDFAPSLTIAISFSSWLMENQIDNILNKFINTEKNKPKNIILTGIPGTGKTHAIMQFLEDNQYKDRYEFVQFYPSYDYEDFIEGLKPIPSSNAQIEFRLVDGIFKTLCKKAYKNKEKIYVMVIDEINRANLSRVFGELLYCLEYRDEFVSTKMTTYIEKLNDAEKKKHSISDDHIGKFTIPSNIIILGTMNEVDRSIDAFDLALRRRFIWEEIGFDETALRLYQPFFVNNFQSHIEDLIKKAKRLNKKLSDDIGINYELGHTYYFKIIDFYTSNEEDYSGALCDLWEYHIKSIVKEYCKIKFGGKEIEDKLKEYKKIIVGDNNNCE